MVAAVTIITHGIFLYWRCLKSHAGSSPSRYLFDQAIGTGLPLPGNWYTSRSTLDNGVVCSSDLDSSRYVPDHVRGNQIEGKQHVPATGVEL